MTVQEFANFKGSWGGSVNFLLLDKMDLCNIGCLSSEVGKIDPPPQFSWLEAKIVMGLV